MFIAKQPDKGGLEGGGMSVVLDVLGFCEIASRFSKFWS